LYFCTAFELFVGFSIFDVDQAREKNDHPVAHFVLQVGEVHQARMLPA
jgi:hypothetical protein